MFAVLSLQGSEENVAFRYSYHDVYGKLRTKQEQKHI